MGQQPIFFKHKPAFFLVCKKKHDSQSYLKTYYMELLVYEYGKSGLPKLIRRYVLIKHQLLVKLFFTSFTFKKMEDNSMENKLSIR